MDSEGCLYPSSRDNLSTDLGCVLCISSLANFLHVHSTKHIWCMTPVGSFLLDPCSLTRDLHNIFPNIVFSRLSPPPIVTTNVEHADQRARGTVRAVLLNHRPTLSLSRTSPFFTVPYTLRPVVYLPAHLKPTTRTPSPASSSLLGPSLFVALLSIPCVLSLILPRYRPTARTPPPTPPSLCLGMYRWSSK